MVQDYKILLQLYVVLCIISSRITQLKDIKNMSKPNFYEKLTAEEMSYLMDRNGLGLPGKKKAKKMLRLKSENEALNRHLDDKAIFENSVKEDLPF